MLIKDDWLTSILGKDVFQLNLVSISNLNFSELPGASSLVVAKLPTDAMQECISLQKSHFYLVDTNIQLQRLVGIGENFYSSENVRFAEHSDEESIAKIAESSFKYDRFHTDPAIANERAAKIKSEWTRNFFKGKRGNSMIVAVEGDAISGFLQILNSNDDSIIIDLIAVNGSQRQKGIATKMIQFAIENCGMEGGNIKVGTQLSNTPSLSLYLKMGFRIISTQHIFHLHI